MADAIVELHWKCPFPGCHAGIDGFQSTYLMDCRLVLVLKQKVPEPEEAREVERSTAMVTPLLPTMVECGGGPGPQ